MPSSPIRLAAVLVLVAGLRAAEPGPAPGVEPTVRVLSTPSGIGFGVWPSVPSHPSPTLFVLAGTIGGTLGQEYFRQCGNRLGTNGWVCVSVDLPCHGSQRRAGEPEGLEGWRRRCELGEDYVAGLNAGLKTVLEDLIRRGITDPSRVAACGTSRGGFAALQFAASEPRVKCVAAFAPVTELGVLAEFNGAGDNPLVRRLGVGNHARELAGRAVWLVIGDRDARVGTDDTIRLARRITAEALQSRREARVELHVIAEPRGHTTPDGAADQAAAWIERQFQ